MNWLAPLSVIARAILEALFNGLWQGIAVCVAAACLMRLSRRPNAATRYAGWWLALVTVAALPLIELGVRFSPPLAPRGVARSASGAFSPLDVRRYKEYLQMIAGDDAPLRSLESDSSLTHPIIGNLPVRHHELLDLLGVHYLLQPSGDARD